MNNSYITELYILKKYLISRDWNNSPATFELIISNAITPLIERIKNKYIKLLHRIHHYCGSDYQWISWFIIWKYMYLKICIVMHMHVIVKGYSQFFFLKSTHRFLFLKSIIDSYGLEIFIVYFLKHKSPHANMLPVLTLSRQVPVHAIAQLHNWNATLKAKHFYHVVNFWWGKGVTTTGVNASRTYSPPAVANAANPFTGTQEANWYTGK